MLLVEIHNINCYMCLPSVGRNMLNVEFRCNLIGVHTFKKHIKHLIKLINTAPSNKHHYEGGQNENI